MLENEVIDEGIELRVVKIWFAIVIEEAGAIGHIPRNVIDEHQYQ